MASISKSSRAFTGGSGQMAVMGEILLRQCNAAVPHIDIGTDVFAFRDDHEEVARIQVKTAVGKRYKSETGFSARFGVPMQQLGRVDNPQLFYALAVRLGDRWAAFIVISRARLQELWNAGCGSENTQSGDLELHIQFRSQSDEPDGAIKQHLTAACGKFQLTEHIGAWESLPPLKTPVDIAPGNQPST
jgi:hypothetical protein